MGDFEEYVDELMVGKTLDALVTATVIFYFKCLLQKAAVHNKTSFWSDNQRALDRMKGDIDTMRGYFSDLEDSYLHENVLCHINWKFWIPSMNDDDNNDHDHDGTVCQPC
jgi:hypothetical protein